MLKKITLALVMCGAVIGGVAVAQPSGPSDTKAERRAELEAKRQAMKQQMLQKFDTNRDGSLDVAERVVMRDEMVLTRFKKLDTDGNGVLSLAEFKAGKDKMGKRHARGGKFGKRGHGPRGAQ